MAVRDSYGKKGEVRINGLETIEVGGQVHLMGGDREAVLRIKRKGQKPRDVALSRSAVRVLRDLLDLVLKDDLGEEEPQNRC